MPDDDAPTPPEDENPGANPSEDAGGGDDTTEPAGGTSEPTGGDASGAAAAEAAAVATPPTVMSRKELQEAKKNGNGTGPTSGSKTWLYVLIGVGVLLVGGIVALVVSSSSKKTAAVKPTVPATTATTGPKVCPLTGTPAPGGVIPPRPAIGVKVGNTSDPGQADDDRPSTGLNQTDIVFEEPVEGSYTRLVAVFQCQTAALVGDIRSARQPDVGIMSQLSNPLLVHAGGIDPVIALLAQAPLQDTSLYSGNNSTAIILKSGRVAPYSTFVNTASIWALKPADTTAPAPIFTYAPTPPAGSTPGSGTAANIDFSPSSNVTWNWNPGGSNYLRSYAYGPDKLLDGSQTAATNVVIMTVPTAQGPWVENSEGGLEVRVDPVGSGPVTILRNGVAITGTWKRTSPTTPNVFTMANGQQIPLAPGNTWEELVPQGDAITVTPGAPAATTTTG